MELILLCSHIATLLAASPPAHPHRFGRPVRQRQNDAGGTAGRAVSRQPDHPHRRLLPPACPAGAGVGNTPLRQHGFKAPAGRSAGPCPGGAAVFLYRILLPGGSLSAARSPASPQRLVLVEGSYSHHPALADCYDLRSSSPVPRRSRPAACRPGRATATRTLPPGGSRWKKPISPSTTLRMPPIS